jgi:hypothetical protein
MPSAFAVLRLMAKSNFVGCSISMSLEAPWGRYKKLRDELKIRPVRRYRHATHGSVDLPAESIRG